MGLNNFAKFREFEHSFWNKTSEFYDLGFGNVTSQVIPTLLKHANTQNDENLLDIACGPGYVTETAQEINVTGIDFSQAMIDFAKEKFPDKEFKVADAESLPFKDESFNAVCSNFGMLHFSNSQKVLQEIYRVCKKEGHYAFSVWNYLEESPAMNLIMQAINEHATTQIDTPESPDFFYFTDQDNSFTALEKSGFKNPKRETLEIKWPIPSGNNYVKYFRDGGARIGAILRAQTPEDINKIVSYIDQGAQNYPGRIVPASIVITSAQK